MGQPRGEKPPLVMGMPGERRDWEASLWLGAYRRDLTRLRWRSLSIMSSAAERLSGGLTRCHHRGTKRSRGGRVPQP